MKKCTKCELEKEVDLFVKNRKVCKSCNSLRYKQYYKENADFVKKQANIYYNENKEECDARNKQYALKNADKLKEANREYYLKNKPEISRKSKIYRDNNKEKTKEYLKKDSVKESRNTNRRRYFKEKRETDLSFKLSMDLRTRLRQAIKNKVKKGSAVKDLGCSVNELIVYIESKFYTNIITGEIMTWNNWGLGKGKWQIDHIIEFRDINVEDQSELLIVTHYTNLQPL